MPSKPVEQMNRSELDRECRERGGKPEFMLIRELRIWVAERRRADRPSTQEESR